MFLRKPRTFYYPGQIIIKCIDTVIQIQSPVDDRGQFIVKFSCYTFALWVQISETRHNPRLICRVYIIKTRKRVITTKQPTKNTRIFITIQQTVEHYRTFLYRASNQKPQLSYPDKFYQPNKILITIF